MPDNDGKITIRLQPYQKDELKRRIPWGMQDIIMRRLVEGLIEAHEDCGDALLYAIEDGRVVVDFR